MPKIVLALPTGKPLKNGKVPPRVLTVARDLSQLLPQYEILVSHSACPREAHAVNLLIDEFLQSPDNQWFVLWDMTVLAEATDILQLVTSGQPVIGALYTNCEERPEWQASFYPDILPDAQHLFPVAEIGPGLKAIHRSALEKLRAEDRHYRFDNSGRSVFAFCEEKLVSFGEYKRLLTPSQSFDLLCRNAKIPLVGHAKVVLGRRSPEGVVYPRKAIPRPWLFKREPPPVIAADLPDAPVGAALIFVCIQHCAKDQTQAVRLEKSIMQAMPSLIYSFGDKYPKGPNDTALQLMRREWTDGIDGVLLLEPDCAPTCPDWFEKLSADWARARAAGKLLMGSWHPVNALHPHLGHLNGCLVFDPQIARKITIPDVPDDEPWDTYLADVFAPHWCRTGLIKNLNRHRTATVAQIATPECGSVPPVLIHGVRDDSVWDYAKTKCAPAS